MQASMKKMRTALILLGVLIVMGGLATWDEWQTKKDKEAEKGKNKIVEFKPEDVTEIDYFARPLVAAEAPDAPGEGSGADPGANPLDALNPGAKQAAQAKAPTEGLDAVLVKSGDVWKVTKPLAVDADANMVKNLITTITDYAYVSVVAATKDKWAEYGLADPSRRLTFKTGGASNAGEMTVFIGKKAPVGYNVYLRTSKDDRVYLGSQHLLMSTTKSLGDLRDKTIVHIEEKNVKAFTYTARSQLPVEVVKGADGKYAIQKPEALAADDAEIRDFFDGVNQLRAEQFVDSPSPAEVSAFSSPDYKIAWTDEKGATSTITALDKGMNLEVAVGPAARIFVVGDQARAKLKKDLINFRNRRIMAINSSDLAKVVVDGDTFQNVNGSWYTPDEAARLDDKGALKASDKGMKPPEHSHVRAFAVDLEFARADQFLAADEAILKDLPPAPEHRVTLNFKDATKQPDIILDVYSMVAQPEKFYVRRTGSPLVYRVAKSVFNSMKASAAGNKDDAGAMPGGGATDLEGLSKALETSAPKTPKG